MKTIRRILQALFLGSGLTISVGVLFLLLVRIERTVEAEGEVRVERFQVVRPQVTGLVSGVFVEAGETVSRGQALVALKDYELQRDLITARQSLNEARTRLEKSLVERRLLTADIQPLEVRKQAAELGQNAFEVALSASKVTQAEIELKGARDQLVKVRKLAGLGVMSQRDVEQAEQQQQLEEQRLAQSRLEERMVRFRRPSLDNDLELLKRQQNRQLSALEAEVRSLEGQVEQGAAQCQALEKLMSLHTLRAEMAGVVTGASLHDLLGRSVRPGEDLFNVIDVKSISFETRVPEQGIVRVRAGQRAYVEILGLPKQRFDVFHGEVGAVEQAPSAKEGAGPILYPVKIRLRDPWVVLAEGRTFYLRSGMQGTAQIAYRQNVPLLDALLDVLVGHSEVRPSARLRAERMQ